MAKPTLQETKMISVQERLGLTTEAVEGALWQWACMLRTAIPAYVVSFDPVAQTIVAQIAIKEIVLKPPPPTVATPNPGVTQNIPTDEPIDQLEDVPIMMMRVPGWSLTFPIVPGTECLLIFADMCVDGWWQNGGLNPQADRRRHDLSDAFALFGPWSQPNNIPNYSTSSVQLRSDDLSVVVDLSSSKISITAPRIDLNSAGNINIHGKKVTILSDDNDTTVDGKVFLLHTHVGVTSGGSNSGPVT